MHIDLLFGGITYEHEISIVSAIALLGKINRGEVIIDNCIFLDSNHDFYLIPKSNMKTKYFSSYDYKKSKKLEISRGGFYEIGLLGKKKQISNNTVLNLIHGADGEDGCIAGLLDFYNISYAGPRIEPSVLTYNKHLTKLYAKECGVETLPFILFRKTEKTPQIPFDFPIIIKPATLGSSIGISIAKSPSDLSYCLDSAFEFCDEVIIEPFKKGIKEYNLAGAKIGGEFVFSMIEEVSKKEFLGFEDKYLDFSRTDKVSEAVLDEGIIATLKESFMKLYNDKFCGAIIRCDFFVLDSVVYINEINPVPGSMANYLFSDFENLLKNLLLSLPKKHHINVSYRYVNQLNSAKGK